jgi:hypothetical protein
MPSAFGMGLTHDLVAHLLGLPGQLAFLDQVRRLLLGTGEDLLGFLASLLEQSIDLGVDAFGGLDLFGDRHAQLVDQIERIRLIDDDAAVRGTFRPSAERLESLDQKMMSIGLALLGQV